MTRLRARRWTGQRLGGHAGDSSRGRAVGLGRPIPAVEGARARRAATCGVQGVEFEHAVGPEHVARRVLAVEGRQLAAVAEDIDAARLGFLMWKSGCFIKALTAGSTLPPR